MHAMTVAVDLAKTSFEVAVGDGRGRVRERMRLSRSRFQRLLDGLDAGTEVVMEACGTAHFWGRCCQQRGLRVRLLPGQYVRAYVRRNKTDRTDAEALLEAARCGQIHPVAVKTLEQQSLQTLHRVRQQWQTTRTARINAIRAILREHGIPLPVGARAGLAQTAGVLAAAHGLPDRVCDLLHVLLAEIRVLTDRVAALDREVRRLVRDHPIARRLESIPGVGPLTATALVGAVGHIHAFRRGREFASWLGLTPREISTGGRRYLGPITKRGDTYLRCLLAHGARALLAHAQRRQRQTPHQLTRVQAWAVQLAARRGPNKAVMALANKLARIVWAVWTRDVAFRPQSAEGLALTV
jgi:transposase